MPKFKRYGKRRKRRRFKKKYKRNSSYTGGVSLIISRGGVRL